jgi:type I restriction enzyme R subunit
MVLLAQAIALEKSISNPKIILVTDRVELDDQITKTFQKCCLYVENASTGQRLVELLESKKDAIVTTVINKFEAAIKKVKKPFESHDIFVLIDEGHRTQYGSFSIQMQKTLPMLTYINIATQSSRSFINKQKVELIVIDDKGRKAIQLPEIIFTK